VSQEAERGRLAARLEHRLQSSLLLLREAVAREDLAGVAEQADAVERRARGLAAAAAGGGPDAVRDALAAWMGGGARWLEAGDELTVEAISSHQPPEVGELGEPLVRLLAEAAGGELVAWEPRRAVVRLPAGPAAPAR
jgi:hypothetical protein